MVYQLHMAVSILPPLNILVELVSSPDARSSLLQLLQQHKSERAACSRLQLCYTPRMLKTLPTLASRPGSLSTFFFSPVEGCLCYAFYVCLCTLALRIALFHFTSYDICGSLRIPIFQVYCLLLPFRISMLSLSFYELRRIIR